MVIISTHTRVPFSHTASGAKKRNQTKAASTKLKSHVEPTFATKSSCVPSFESTTAARAALSWSVMGCEANLLSASSSLKPFRFIRRALSGEKGIQEQANRCGVFLLFSMDRAILDEQRNNGRQSYSALFLRAKRGRALSKAGSPFKTMTTGAQCPNSNRRNRQHTHRATAGDT